MPTRIAFNSLFFLARCPCRSSLIVQEFTRTFARIKPQNDRESHTRQTRGHFRLYGSFQGRPSHGQEIEDCKRCRPELCLIVQFDRTRLLVLTEAVAQPKNV